MNPYRGWEIYPKAIYDVAINVRDNYDNIPWYISENGMGVEGEEKFIGEDGIVADDYRIDFIREHLEWLHKGIEEGSNCFGTISGRRLTAGLGRMPTRTATDSLHSISSRRRRPSRSPAVGSAKSLHRMDSESHALDCFCGFLQEAPGSRLS